MYKSNNKKRILIIIDNFGQGGAETMLVNLFPSLNKDFSIVLVTLNSISDFKKEEIICASRFILNFQSFKDAPRAIFQLKKISI